MSVPPTPSSDVTSFVPVTVLAPAVAAKPYPMSPILPGGVPFTTACGEDRVLAWLMRSPSGGAAALDSWAQHHSICLSCSNVPRRVQGSRKALRDMAGSLSKRLAGAVSTLVSIPADRAGGRKHDDGSDTGVWWMPSEPTKTGRVRNGWRVVVTTHDPWVDLVDRGDGYREGHPGSGNSVLSAWPLHGATIPHIRGEALDGLFGWRPSDHESSSHGIAPYDVLMQRLRGDCTL